MMNHEPTPVPHSNWKWIGIPVLIAVIFMGLLYLAMATEPDYMPAQQKKAAGVDVHAKHANATTANSESEEVTSDEHSSHSATEHAEAIAKESSEMTATPSSHNEHGH